MLTRAQSVIFDNGIELEYWKVVRIIQFFGNMKPDKAQEILSEIYFTKKTTEVEQVLLDAFEINGSEVHSIIKHSERGFCLTGIEAIKIGHIRIDYSEILKEEAKLKLLNLQGLVDLQAADPMTQSSMMLWLLGNFSLNHTFNPLQPFQLV